ncbi:kinase-like domain-containing protein [Aspergillus venezuelensis]
MQITTSYLSLQSTVQHFAPELLEDDVYPTVSVVRVPSWHQNQKFAYKTIDRPIYIPEDTQCILDEVNVLAQVRGERNIAQIVGVVCSENPYKSHRLNPGPKKDMVLTGFLMEYYTGGSLDSVIEKTETKTKHNPENEIDSALPIVQWAKQIGQALRALHRRGLTHSDVKPANVVMDGNGDAVLVDVGGTGGSTMEWLAPEMARYIQQSEGSFADAPFGQRVMNDCWAFGRVLEVLADVENRNGFEIEIGSGSGDVVEKARRVVAGLMEEDTKVRSSLDDALARL